MSEEPVTLDEEILDSRPIMERYEDAPPVLDGSEEQVVENTGVSQGDVSQPVEDRVIPALDPATPVVFMFRQ